jgi:hypothetical protein
MCFTDDGVDRREYGAVALVECVGDDRTVTVNTRTSRVRSFEPMDTPVAPSRA